MSNDYSNCAPSTDAPAAAPSARSGQRCAISTRRGRKPECAPADVPELLKAAVPCAACGSPPAYRLKAGNGTLIRIFCPNRRANGQRPKLSEVKNCSGATEFVSPSTAINRWAILQEAKAMAYEALAGRPAQDRPKPSLDGKRCKCGLLLPCEDCNRGVEHYALRGWGEWR